MRPSRPEDRRRRQATPRPEMLETRQLLTGGAGNTFAIMPANIASAGAKAVVPFAYSPTVMTLTPRHQITLGVDVAAQSGSKVIPRILGIENLQTHRMMPIVRSNYVRSVHRVSLQPGDKTTAVLTTLHLTPAQARSTQNYAVVVQGIGGTTGQLLVGFYLPGDALGNGAVNGADVAAIKQDMNVKANSPNYVFAYDANRDGTINRNDLRIAESNLGASVTVTPVVSANLNPASDSGIQDRITNIQTVMFDGKATPFAKVTYTDLNNSAPTTSTTADVNGMYALKVPLGPGDNTFQVSATDAFGQTITGVISPVTYSMNAPAVATPSNIPATPTVNLAPAATTTATKTTAATTGTA